MGRVNEARNAGVVALKSPSIVQRSLVQRAVLAGTAALSALALGEGAAHAQGTLDARYEVTLGGVPFGRGAWHINVADDQFTSAVSGTTTGLLSMFSTGRGTSASRGAVAKGGALNASSYSSSIATTQKYDEVRMQLSSGTVKDYLAEPPVSPDPERVPVEAAHRRNVLDPMTAAILRVPGNGDTFVPEACNRKVAVFDGRMRYDVQLGFKRLDRVRSDKGYQGTVVVCSVVFAPVAGHIPSRPVIKYLTQLRQTEAWLAPIAGTRFMVPYKATMPTPLGMGVLQATQFVTVPQQAARPTPTSARQ
ncbi:MAG: DUF3108 domain-containing protein [Xanthobacteraceae bacterium]|nr:DUF3108 domain-containing protein [Xanthobacteraceae bacterium]